MKKDEKGFGAVEVLVIVLVVALLGFGGWYVLQSKNNDDKKSSTSNNTQTEDTQQKENSVTLKVGDYSIELEVPESLKDLKVGSSRDSTFEGKAFTQVTLVTDKFDTCTTPGGVLGTITKLDGTYSSYPYGVIDEIEGVYVTQLGDFYLMYQGSQSTMCGEVDAASTYAEVKQAIIDNDWEHKTN